MYLNLDEKPKDAIALRDSANDQLTYGQLCASVEELGTRTEKRSVIFCLCRNDIGAALGYLAFVNGGQVPLLLSDRIDPTLLDALVNTYAPAYFYYPEELDLPFGRREVARTHGYVLARTDAPVYPVHDELSLLLPTSGSTGSPKLVRHAYRNLCANARNVATAFSVAEDERALLELPLQYTMGLSVLSSHLYRGARVVLTRFGLTETGFYRQFREEGITSFTGVPYTFEILSRLRFTRSDWPELRLLSVGGGRLSDRLIEEFATFCQSKGGGFVSSFGQTECTARMALLEPQYALTKLGSIGKAIPEGRLYLIDENGKEIAGEGDGEMCYDGPNVTMGYATCREDLQKGDEWHGVRHTGDLAHRDDEGFFFITGRLSRFLKIYGVRVGLDESEKLLRAALNTDCACTGTDKLMRIYLTDAEKERAAVDCMAETTGLPRTVFSCRHIAEIPRNETGKILYAQLPDG